MLEKLLDPSVEDVSKLIWNLYGQFCKGLPAGNLRPLLVSPILEVQSRGAFLANELGRCMRPLRSELGDLIDSPHPGVRFDAIGALTFCTTDEDGELLGRIFQHLEDSSVGVRWSMVEFLRLTDSEKLLVAISNAARQRPASIYTEIDNCFGRSMIVTEARVSHFARHANAALHVFATGIALRPRKIVDEAFADIILSEGGADAMMFVERLFRMPRDPSGAQFGRVEASSLRNRLAAERPGEARRTAP